MAKVCSYQRVFPKLNEPQEKDPVMLLNRYRLALPLLRDLMRAALSPLEQLATARKSQVFRGSGGLA